MDRPWRSNKHPGRDSGDLIPRVVFRSRIGQAAIEPGRLSLGGPQENATLLPVVPGMPQESS